jgi:hypothetical protein
MASQNHPDLLVGKSALREHLDEVAVVFVNVLRLAPVYFPLM